MGSGCGSKGSSNVVLTVTSWDLILVSTLRF